MEGKRGKSNIPVAVIKESIIHQHGNEKLSCSCKAIRNISQISNHVTVENKHRGRDSHQLIKENQNQGFYDFSCVWWFIFARLDFVLHQELGKLGEVEEQKEDTGQPI